MQIQLNKKLVGSLVMTSVLTTSLITVVPAYATNDGKDAVTITNSEVASHSDASEVEAELTDFLVQYGVPEKTQIKLIQKFEKGQIWDSLTGVEPVSVEVSIKGNNKVTIQRFADGSISVTTIEIPTSEKSNVTSRSVTGCQVTSSSSMHENHSNCYASADTGFMQLGFHFDRQTYAGATGRITKTYGMTHRIIGGALTNHRIEQHSSNHARYSADLSVAFKGFPVGWTAWMEVTLGKGVSATVNHN